MKILTTTGLTELIAKIKEALSGKVNTSDVITATTIDIVTSVDSSSTDSQVPTAKAVYEAIPTELADLTGDSTHRVVTDTEKATWNGKWTAVNASTSTVGIVQLNDSLLSTDTTKALTANQGYVLNNAKEPKGVITINSTAYQVAVSTTDVGTVGYITFVVES